MSEVKRFTAIVKASSEYETLYGVVSISRGEWQQMMAVSDLMGVVSKKWPHMRKISGWDASVAWFDTVPWVQSEDEAIHDKQGKIEEEVDEGDWVEVDPDWVDLEHDSGRSTTCEEVHIDSSSVHFSLYPKHSDTLLETPWLMFSVLRQHFERR